MQRATPCRGQLHAEVCKTSTSNGSTEKLRWCFDEFFVAANSDEHMAIVDMPGLLLTMLMVLVVCALVVLLVWWCWCRRKCMMLVVLCGYW